MMKQEFVRRSFSLIELLIVIGILGALLTLVLPGFNDTSDDAKDKVARTEMKEIQKQFQRLYADMLGEFRKEDSVTSGTTTAKSNHYLRDVAWYGVWPLLVQHHPARTEAADWGGALYSSDFKKFDAYDGDAGFGWRGPYLEYEGIREIAAPELIYAYSEASGVVTVANYGGQTAGTATPAIKIPVIRDPYGGYYRVLCPEARSSADGGNELDEYERLKRIVLVCTGRNRKLETKTNSFMATDAADYVKSINGDDIAAAGDDIVVRLIPTAF